MTDHVVIQTRDAIVQRLKDLVESVGERVYLLHQIPGEEVDAENSPFIVVVLGDESCERIGVNGADGDPALLEDILLQVGVHCVVKMDGDAEAAAKAVRAEAETALLSTVAGLTLDGTVQMITRVAAVNNRDDALDQGAYAEMLQLEVKIRHLEGRPTSFDI